MNEEIDKDNLPIHIAITMDGNGRWAKEKGKLRIFGHTNGTKAVRNVVEGAAEIGIKYLTLYAFSKENWKRPKKEVESLMTLLISTINKEIKTLMKNNIKLITIGDTEELPKKCIKELKHAIKETENNSRMTLTLALSYSGKWDIISAVKKIISSGVSEKEITYNKFQQYLSTKNVPDPELLIRTGGDYRISNFLLWQIAYSELVFAETLWPDFTKKDLYKAILEFQKRERRFGKTK